MRLLDRTKFGIGLLLFLGAGGVVSALGAGGVDEGSVGKCKECHARQAESFFSGNPHSKIWKNKTSADVAYSCETCHGSGEKHMKDREASSIISFSKGAKREASQLSQQCLSCHTKSEKLAFWDMGAHKKNDVTCASCHKMHQGGEAVKPTAEVCLTCHKDIKSQVNKRSHHPIIEGKVTCADCHNPHGSLNPKMLNAESTNQLCYKCHADKRGPFLWEHAPVEENCATCHAPHGSSHAKLLVEKVPNLCKNCHIQDGHGGAAYDGQLGFAGTQKAQFIAKGCVNCHSRIHGSNAPGGTPGNFNSGQYFLR